MGCKTDLSDQDVRLGQMKCGQIGVVTYWGNVLDSPVGKVVQRFEDNLIVLGEQSGSCYSSGIWLAKSCRVRLLGPGDSIQIEEIVS